MAKIVRSTFLQGGAEMVGRMAQTFKLEQQEERGSEKKNKIKTWSRINILCVICCFQYSVTPPIPTINSSQWT